MADTRQFRCQACGAYLEFDPTKKKLTCPYCGAETEITAQQNEPVTEAETAGAAETVQAGAFKSYHCSTCGAEVVTETTTAATRCYYCHQPVVMTDRLSGAFKPDMVLPFAMSRDKALETFKQFLKTKKYVDRRFFSDDQLENLSGVYYPYWLGDLESDVTFDGTGATTDRRVTAKETQIITRNYRLHREATLTFRNMVRKALTKADRTLSDGIHPYALGDAKSFAPEYLSGYLAEMRDVEASSAEAEMQKEARELASSVIRRGYSYSEVKGKTDVEQKKAKMRYALLPAWVLTYKAAEPGQTYYFMMNAQTGTVCGRLPIDKKKLFASCATVFAVVAGLLCLGGMFIW